VVNEEEDTMKKIINGKLYDTDKATYLGYDMYAGPRDFKYWKEEFYKKRTGEFFLYGQGGPDSKYAVASVTGSGWDGGEKIIPLSYDKAREWAEAHLNAEAYGEIFGMPGEDAGDAALNIQIDAGLMARLRARAAEDGASLTATVAALLENGLEW
jgi:hypothetical protein